MSNGKAILQICNNSLKKSFSQPRFYIACFLFLVMALEFNQKVRLFSSLVGIGVSPWVLPFIVTNTGYQIFVLLGAMLIFCDAPFLKADATFTIVRSGRKNWFWGNMLYILVTSLVYVLCLWLISVLTLIPRLEFQADWGKVLGTLAQTAAGKQVRLNQLSYSIIKMFSPLQATALTLLAMLLNSIMMGTVCYAMNLWLRNGSGIIVDAVIALSATLMHKLVSYQVAYYFAPPLWMDLSKYNWKGQGDTASPIYIYGFFLCVIVITMIISYIGVRKKDLIIAEKL